VFLSAAMDWAGKTSARSVDEINAKRQNMKAGGEQWERRLRVWRAAGALKLPAVPALL
jgi:hypothetical protein